MLFSTEFLKYFSTWKHAKLLIGTCTCWFFLDIAYASSPALRLLTQLMLILYPPRFYGINLNQNIVLQQIGFDGKTGTAWERMYKIGVGNLIITALGFVPGSPLLQLLALNVNKNSFLA